MPTDWGGGAGADIGRTLVELGRIRGENMVQQGNIWGHAIANIGNTIEQAPVRQIQQQEIAARTAELQGLAQDRQLKAAALLREQQGTQVLAQAIGDPANQGDPEKVYQAVASAGFPEHAQKYLKAATDNSEALGKLSARRRENDQTVADMFSGVDPSDTVQVHSVLGLLQSHGVDPSPYAKVLDDMGPEAGIKHILDTAPENVKATRTRAEKAAEEAAKPLVVPEGAGVYQGNTMVVEPTPKTKSMQAESVLLDGKPARVNYHPDTGTYTDTSGADVSTRVKPLPPASVVYPKPEASAATVEIKPGTPEYKVARDLATGALTFGEFRTLVAYSRDPGKKMGIYALAGDLNPEFNPSQFELGYKMAGNPAIRNRLVAINALGPVIDRVSQLADQVGNGGVPAWNKLLNAAKFQLGSRTVTNYNQLLTLLGEESGNALGVGTGSDLKTKLGISLVDGNLSGENLKSNLQQLDTVLQARKAELVKQMGVYGPGVDAGGSTPTTVAPTGGASARPAAPTVGSVVSFQGKRYKVTGIRNGAATLEAIQ